MPKLTAHRKAYNNFRARVNRLLKEGYILDEGAMERAQRMHTKTLNSLRGRELRFSSLFTGVQSYDPVTGVPRAVISTRSYNRYVRARERYNRSRAQAGYSTNNRRLYASSDKALDKATERMNRWNPQEARQQETDQLKDALDTAFTGAMTLHPTIAPLLDVINDKIQHMTGAQLSNLINKVETNQTPITKRQLLYGEALDIDALMDLVEMTPQEMDENLQLLGWDMRWDDYINAQNFNFEEEE